MSFAINQGLFLLDITDHHAILGLPIDAELKAVRKAYLKIAQRLHPDICKAQGDQNKELASNFLSKLVNPAYEKLSKRESWVENQFILKQLAKQLGNNGKDSLKLKFESSQALEQVAEASENFAEAYHAKVKELAQANYLDMSAVLVTIEELSELNLVYLNISGKMAVNAKTTSSSATATSRNQTLSQATSTSSQAGTIPEKETQSQPHKSTSPSTSTEAAIWRGEEHLKKKNYAKATLEFRDAIKLDPNSFKAHAMMGMAYLQQKQVAMAKVHIKKAYLLKPSDPLTRKAKQALEKEMGSALQTQSGKKNAGQQKKGGFFGGLFGGKKK